MLVNDWSARDIQAWEYVPLGPFLGKSFATSMSAWVLPLAALDAARVAPPARDRAAALPRPAPDDGASTSHSRSSSTATWCPGRRSRTMYWTPAQQLAHLTVNGASLRTGDLFASGTVSGPEPDQRGSFIELSLERGQSRSRCRRGRPGRSWRTATRSTSPRPHRAPGGARIALGEVTGRIVPAPGTAGGGPAVTAADTRAVIDPDTYRSGPPLDVLRRLRSEAAVVWVEEPEADRPAGPGYWRVLRHADVDQVLRDPATFSSHLGGTQIRDPPGRTSPTCAG